MAEEVKFTKEELDKVTNFQGKYSQVRNDFGDMSLSRISLSNQLNELNDLEAKLHEELKKIQMDETNFLNELNKKYGEGTLDPQTGVFKSNKS